MEILISPGDLTDLSVSPAQGRTALDTDNGLNLFARDLAAIGRLIAQVRNLKPGVSAASFPLIDRAATLVAVLAVMGHHERVNPRDGAKMIAYVKKATRNFGA